MFAWVVVVVVVFFLLNWFSYFRLKIITFEQDVELGDKDRERESKSKSKISKSFFLHTYLRTYTHG